MSKSQSQWLLTVRYAAASIPGSLANNPRKIFLVCPFLVLNFDIALKDAIYWVMTHHDESFDSK